MPKRSVCPPIHHCQCGDHAWTALTRGYITFVSIQDLHLLNGRIWRSISSGANVAYAITGTKTLLHHLIFPNGEADHKNRNGCDNRRSNLRPATRSQNLANRKIKKRALPRGVYHHRKRFAADIRTNGRTIHLALYDTPEQAAKVYDAAAIRIFGEFATLNFSQG